MQSRRSFFARLGALVAVVAMAPEIAFSAKLDVQPKLNLEELFERVYAIARSRLHQPAIDVFTDRQVLTALYSEMDKAYESPFLEPVNLQVLGIYEQLRMANRA